MYLLGIDIGTSSVKVSVIDAETKVKVAAAQFPEGEAPIQSPKPGWYEQHPEDWWSYTQKAIIKANATGKYNPKDIKGIGISYQMHGLVLLNRHYHVLRPSIIWCDSRAVAIGENAFEALGKDYCRTHLLNSPGNFTASKLAWVQQNEPHIYRQIHAMMLPGDYVSFCLTGQATTSVSALSEGIFWDFKNNTLCNQLFEYYKLDTHYIPAIHPVFGTHGGVSPAVADELGLKAGTPVTYKCGDQPNNAFSLNVQQPGEIAATAGTSGVLYGVTQHLSYDAESRVNSFAHVNHTAEDPRIGILLCINGTGNAYNWARRILGPQYSYNDMNFLSQSIPAGAHGLMFLPFGNGAERMLNNTMPGAQLFGIDLNVHTPAHYFRAVQEGIAYSFRYGLDIMRENGLAPTKMKAGRTNMFLSDTFCQALTHVTNLELELYDTEGSVGAAIAAGIGLGTFNAQNAFVGKQPVQTIKPGKLTQYEDFYQQWKQRLLSYLP